MAQSNHIQSSATVSFAARLASSENFKGLFKEGMGLVENSASYLDGPGREDARTLPRMEALAYASESMRLTTRLMQLASWLLLQRAVNEGEMTQVQAAADKHKVRLSNQEIAASDETYARLPTRLRELVEQSLRLQTRVLKLDQLIYQPQAEAAPEFPIPSAVHNQLEMLRTAFAGA